MPLLTHVALVCEISQIFLNIRNLIGKNDDSLISNINKILFFVSYSILRICGIPILLFIHIYSTNFYNFWNSPNFV